MQDEEPTDEMLDRRAYGTCAFCKNLNPAQHDELGAYWTCKLMFTVVIRDCRNESCPNHSFQPDTE